MKLRALAVAVAVAGALVLILRATSDDAPAARPGVVAGATRTELPGVPTPAFTIGPAVAAKRNPNATTWVSVRSSTVARRAPSAAAPQVARLNALTPEDTTNIVLPLARRRDARGRLWVRVRLPVLPNGSTGWVPRAALGTYGTVTTKLVVNLERRTATLLRDGRAVLRAPVGVGTAGAPTPRGTFVVRNVLTRFSSDFYGPIAFGTSARSATLTDWPGGGFIGIHGTNAPGLIPGRVSHGCIRMRNADILRLAKRMPIGTPLTIA